MKYEVSALLFGIWGLESCTFETIYVRVEFEDLVFEIRHLNLSFGI